MARDKTMGEGLQANLLEEGSTKAQPRRLKRRVTMICNVEETLSFWGAVGSLLVSMLGPGIVAYPFAISLCGYTLGPVVLIMFCTFAYESYCALLRCTKKLETASYDGLLSLLPSAWGHCANASLAVLLILACSMYILVAADTLSAISANLPGASLLAVNWIRFAVLVVALFPLCLTRTLSGLASVTSFCFACIAVVAVLVVWLCTQQWEGEAAHDAVVVKATSPELVLRAIPIFSTSLFGHMNFPRLYAEMKTEVKPQAEAVARTSVVILCCLLLVFGLAGYAVFGQSVQGDILTQLALAQGETWSMGAAQALMLLFVILKTPLMVFPMRALVLAAARPGQTLSDLSAVSNVLLTVSLLVCVYAAACLLPNLNIVMTLLGALCCVPLTFIFPARLLHMAEPDKGPWRSGLLGFVGVAISGMGFYVFFV